MSHARRGKVLYIPGSRPERFDESPGTTAPRERRGRWIIVASLLGALGFFWAGVRLSHREETAGIRSLPASERQSLYARTLSEVSTICLGPAAVAGDLHDHCIAQARFVMELPECDDACLRAIAAVLPHARR